jgi:CRISPR system Cascade subunit CasD
MRAAGCGWRPVENAVDKPVDKLSRRLVSAPSAAPPAVEDSVEKPVRAPVHRPVLLLRLEGPHQSWGIRARWDVRDTAPEPTKSGVIGLLGCALGYAAGDPRLEGLDRGLRFGVRVESPGRVVEDYQTVTGFLPAADGRYRRAGITNAASWEHVIHGLEAAPAAIVSRRCYLEDAAFLVALEETGAMPGLLARCAAAVHAPSWPLYLGRKACVPTRPIFEALTASYCGIEEALRRHPWSWHGAAMRSRPAPRRARISVEATDSRQVRPDALRVNPVRQYAFRPVRHLEPVAPPGTARATT